MENQNEIRKATKKGIIIGVLGACLIIIVACVVLIALAYNSKKTTSEPSVQSNEVLNEDSVQKIEELVNEIGKYYYEDIDTEQLTVGLYKGLFEGIGDPYSEYYTKEEYESMMADTSGTYYGIGAVLSQDVKTMQVTVLHVYEGTPADKAGVKDGDIIVKVGDIVANSMELSELVTHIRGDKNTTVHMQLYRDGEEDYIELDIERDKVEVPTVSYKMLPNQVGYIDITEFSEPTAEQFMEAVKDLEKQGMKAMMVDLRNNPGGYLTAVTEILDEILPKGLTVYIEDKEGNRQEFKSDNAHQMDYPLVVLINENSASASEIFAGAIKDYEYGTLIGTTTFGKGIVQSLYQLSDGSAIKLTTAKYYTPKGNYIHEKGIEPDIELEYEYLGDPEGEYSELEDNQIQKGLDILKKKLK